MTIQRCLSCGEEAVVRRLDPGGAVTNLCEKCLTTLVKRRRRLIDSGWWMLGTGELPVAEDFPGLTIVNLSEGGAGPRCTNCGCDWREFSRTRRLNCPVCYGVYGEILSRFFSQLERPGFN